MAVDPSNPLKIVGAPGSPYSRKLRAVLRYRRIPHHWVVRGSRADLDTPKTPVALMPVLVFPGQGGSPDEAFIDSTPLIRRLEKSEPLHRDQLIFDSRNDLQVAHRLNAPRY